ncbi:MAG TPA: transcription antitermination factor NusB [Acidimicrobiales bacterium]|nr:transcription antitermination factor NusB [Acidimicrobiales bacterium]
MNTSRGPSRDAGAPAAGARRRGRERALSLLYEAESKGETADKVLGGLPVLPERYAMELFEGVMANEREIDTLVGEKARSWSVNRMPVIDRQLLRLATFELMCRPDIPYAVVIDEAVELAKEYSTEDSSRFVNGILAALGRELRPEEVAHVALDGRALGK